MEPKLYGRTRRSLESPNACAKGSETKAARLSVGAWTIKKVERTVGRVLARLPSNHRKRLLVAVSGGPDSVALLHALHRIRPSSGFEIVAAHLNHGIRGTESDRDQQFVTDLCWRLGLELMIERAQGLKQSNLEERARDARYRFLNRAADSLDAQFIVLGHHQGDQAETILLRLLRGTGIAGLAAMSEFGPGRLVRPLLSLDRETVVAYLEAIDAKYVIDSSNLGDRALRNRVRGTLLPYLARDYSPGISRRLAELASEMSELDLYISAEACRLLGALLLPSRDPGQASAYRVDIRKFESISPALAHAIMRKLVERGAGDLRRTQRAHIDAMCGLAAGSNPSGSVILPRGWRFRREQNTAVLEQMMPPGTCATQFEDRSEVALLPGENRLSCGNSILILREINAGEPSFPASPWHPPSRFQAYFDAGELATLSVRCWRSGDRIRPLGLSGSRKVQDVFVDNKLSVASRRCWPLVLSGSEVVWIPGLVRSSAALITSKSRKVLHLCADSLPDDLKVRLPEL